MGVEDKAEENNSSVVNSTAAHVAVKPPAFDESSVARWFKILESMFITARVTSSQTKFHHTLSNLPVNVASQLSDAVIDSADYETLKKALVSQFTKPTPELFEDLINSNKIAFTRPTQYLNEIRKIGQQLSVNEDFLKIKFLKSLPDHIRPIIVSKEGITLDEMAHAADCIMEYEAGVTGEYGGRSHGCASISHNGSRRSGAEQPNYNPNSNSKTQHNGGTGNFSRPNYNDHSIPYSIRAFNSSQRPQVCRAHLYFGSRAKYCKPWCVLADKKLPMHPNSRSASPARFSGN